MRWRVQKALCVGVFLALIPGLAAARTAIYVSPASIDPGPLAALSTRGDRAGYTVTLDQTLAMLFSQPFATVRNSDRVTVYTLAPSRGDARALVSVGFWNNGAPVIVRSQNVNAGGSVSFTNLFQTGCSVFQGCDYISITTTRARNGAAGTGVDYVDINGEVTDVSSPTPAPETWALMILGFVAAAGRLKTLRRTGSVSRLGPGLAPIAVTARLVPAAYGSQHDGRGGERDGRPEQARP
jgi:hypothetical protein